MHDFFLAKEILKKTSELIKEKKIEKISRVFLEVGSVVLAHDGLPEHMEDINMENLQFGIKGLSRGTELEGVEFDIKKTADNNWKITDIELE